MISDRGHHDEAGRRLPHGRFEVIALLKEGAPPRRPSTLSRSVDADLLASVDAVRVFEDAFEPRREALAAATKITPLPRLVAIPVNAENQVSDLLTALRADERVEQAGRGERAGYKIVLQRQLPDLGVHRLHIHLTDGANGHNIACKIDGIGGMDLKSEFVKKA